jgi:DNA polymerase-3 subunit delta'
LSLIGFDKIKTDFLSLFKQNKLHHAILLSGKEGVGKASFALEFALEIIGSKNKNHPDLLLIEKEEGKRDISIDQIRKIAPFLNQTSAISKNRFIIVDAADNFNKSSANAILKVLEEPSKNCFLILISHSLSKLLPTIKSRCQIVKINDLSFEEFKTALENSRPKFLPKITDNEIKALSLLCDNSPSKAIKSGDDFIFLYQNLLISIDKEFANNELLKKISDKKFEFENAIEVVGFFFLRLMKFYAGQSDYFLFDEKDVFQNLQQKFNFEQIFVIKDRFFGQINKVKILNLDKKVFFINFINDFS